MRSSINLMKAYPNLNRVCWLKVISSFCFSFCPPVIFQVSRKYKASLTTEVFIPGFSGISSLDSLTVCEEFCTSVNEISLLGNTNNHTIHFPISQYQYRVSGVARVKHCSISIWNFRLNLKWDRTSIFRLPPDWNASFEA